MIRIALAAVFCLPIQMFAQQSAPEIKFHAQNDFFKLPPELYFGEAAGVAVNSKGHVFVFSRGGTTGPAYGAAAVSCSSLMLTESTSVKSGAICMHGALLTPSRSTGKTTYGSPTRDRTWSSSSIRKAGY